MTLSLPAAANPERRYWRTPARFRLVEVELFSDRADEVVGETFYLSSHPVRFDGNDYRPFVAEIGEIREQMTHLPSPGDVASWRRPLTLELLNAPFKDSRLASLLRANHLVTNARVTVRESLQAPSLWPIGPVDFSALASDAFWVRYRGRVRTATYRRDAIRMVCETVLPEFDWPIADGAKTRQRDRGKRLPIVFARLPKVPGVLYQAGWVSTLAQTIDDSTTGNFDVTDASDLNGLQNFDARVGNEEMVLDYVDDDTVDIEGGTRGSNGTTAQAHNRGEIVMELDTDFVWVVNAYESQAVDAVYLRNPQNGELVRLQASDYTVDLTNTSLISGRTVTTITMSQAQMSTVMDEFFSTVDASGSGSTEPDILSVDASSRGLGRSVSNHNTTIATDPAGVRIQKTFSGNDRASEWWIGVAPAASNRVVQRWRIRWTYNVEPNTSEDMDLILDTDGMPGGDLTQTISIPNGGSFSAGVEVATGWKTPSGTVTVGEFEGSSSDDNVDIYLSGSTGSSPGFVFVYAPLVFEFELEPEAVDVEASNKGSSVGFDLELFADLKGIPTPTGESPAYKSVDEITRLADLLRYWAEAIPDANAWEVDEDSYDDTDTNLGGATVDTGFDARSLGQSWGEVMAAMAADFGVNLVPFDDPDPAATARKFRMLAADASYQFPAATESITEWDPDGFEEEAPDLELLGTRWTFPYAFDASRGSDESGFSDVVIANPDEESVPETTTADLAAAEEEFGRKVVEPIPLPTIQGQTLAEERAGYYVHEGRRVPRIFSIRGVPRQQSYLLQAGDTRNVTPPWESSALKCRVLSKISRADGSSADLRLIEVE